MWAWEHRVIVWERLASITVVLLCYNNDFGFQVKIIHCHKKTLWMGVHSYYPMPHKGRKISFKVKSVIIDMISHNELKLEDTYIKWKPMNSYT